MASRLVAKRLVRNIAEEFIEPLSRPNNRSISTEFKFPEEPPEVGNKMKTTMTVMAGFVPGVYVGYLMTTKGFFDSKEEKAEFEKAEASTDK